MPEGIRLSARLHYYYVRSVCVVLCDFFTAFVSQFAPEGELFAIFKFVMSERKKVGFFDKSVC